MEPLSFAVFYLIVTGHNPFRWQEEVADLLVQGKWREALALPPATGKTAFILCWFYALYRNCLTGGPRHIPLRLFYVVDRKVIVDSAHELALLLEEKLSSVPDLEPVGQAIKDRLRCDVPLIVAKMRGGLENNIKNAWVQSPVQPAIVMTTVDQYGSRLLFRGYGVTPKNRSVPAGLVAFDSLMVLDESHLAQPLYKVIATALADYKPDLFGGLPRSRVVELTATAPANRTGFITVESLANDPSPVLRRRLAAKRTVGLLTVNGGKADYVKTLVKSAKDSVREGVTLVAVICNTVNRARAVHTALKGSLLLTARIRHHDRTRLYKCLDTMLAGKRDRSRGVQFVVTTQTIEVGADLDFDAMVSESAPLDCLIQRFGRLNRIGDLGQTYGTIVHWKDNEDRIYGTKTEETFNLLSGLAVDDKIENFADVPRNTAYYALPNRIPLLPHAILERLAHTNPNYDLDIHPYLHGVAAREVTEIHIVYRSDIDLPLLKKFRSRNETLELAKPLNHELLSIPISALYAPDADLADTEYGVEDEENRPVTDRRLLHRLCVRASDGKVIFTKEIRGGETVIVPCEFGCHDAFGWNPASDAPVEDVYDYQNRVLRLRRDLIPGFRCENHEDEDGVLDYPAMLTALRDKIGPEWKKAHPADAERVAYIRRKTHAILQAGVFRPQVIGSGIYLSVPHPGFGPQQEQTLEEHTGKVVKWTTLYANALDLPQPVVKMLILAARLHDLGKAERRFQQDLYHPAVWNPNVLLGKSKRVHKPVYVPGGWRHELQSLAVIVENRLHDKCHDPEALLHLVASHHGHYRNYFPVRQEDTAFEPFTVFGWRSTRSYVDVCVELGREAFYRLNRKYGFWGLAFLESVLRLADIKGSSHESS